MIQQTLEKHSLVKLGVAEVLAGSSEIGRSPALRAFRQKLKQLRS